MPIVHLLAASSSKVTDPKKQCVSNSHWECDNSGIAINEEYELCENINPVLIDTSGRVEDAWALIMAIEAHHDSSILLKIAGITCVHGLIPVDSVVGNVAKVLTASNTNDVKIFRGAESAMVHPLDSDDDIEEINDETYHPKAEKQHAISAIIESATAHKGKLRILALGPLTNLAMAVKTCPKIRNYVKEIFIVGGNHQAFVNPTSCAEYNISSDPEAAHVVLSMFKCPIYVLPLETCMKMSTCSSHINSAKLREINTKKMNFLNRIESKALFLNHEYLAVSALGAAAFIDPELITKMENKHCKVELQGNYTRGLFLMDHHTHSKEISNVSVISEIDLQRFEQMITWAVGGKLNSIPLF